MIIRVHDTDSEYFNSYLFTDSIYLCPTPRGRLELNTYGLFNQQFGFWFRFRDGYREINVEIGLVWRNEASDWTIPPESSQFILAIQIDTHHTCHPTNHRHHSLEVKRCRR